MSDTIWNFTRNTLELIFNILGFCIVYGFILFLLVVAVFCMVYTIRKVVLYAKEKTNEEEKDKIYLEFDKFDSLYFVNPEKWSLLEDHVSYKDVYRKQESTYKTLTNCCYDTNMTYPAFMYVDKEIETEFWFSGEDVKKYKKWKAEREHFKREKKKAEQMQDVLNAIQKDIDKLSEQEE